MFGLLPDLSPRDSHSLWYTSSRNPFSTLSGQDVRPNGQNPEHGHGHPHGPGGNPRRGAHLIERSPLARLRSDEQNLERRQQNVTNFGSAWLKPPGLPKTLHQLREERREAEEHQEALRREQLAQELAEAEAEAAGAVAGEGATAGGGDADMALDAPAGGDDGMDDVQLDGARDLDDEVPEADEADFGFSDNDDDEDDEEDDEDDEEDEEEEDEEERDEDTEEREMLAAQAQQQQLMAQRMRQANDAFREDMARGRDSAAFYGGDEDIDDEDQSQMIEEDDLVSGAHHADDDMGMDADLDDEIPEAESLGGYEHTDTEAELSSIIDEDDEHNNSRLSFVAPQANRLRHSFARSDATRNSIAISDILSRDGSSVLGSSPAVPRQRTALSSRRGGRG
ncbi:Apc15p protein-domain-containing protein [Xylaria arbuscula]|nr:Apc15p protein-domain-containing protein [Xylaria arbuscula]